MNALPGSARSGRFALAFGVFSAAALAGATTRTGVVRLPSRTVAKVAGRAAQTAGGLQPSDFAGTWNGQWNNFTFGSSGSAKLVVTVNTSAKTFSATLTLGGNVFGESAPPPQTFSGSYGTDQGSFSGHDATFGDFTFTVGSDGIVSGSAMNVPNPSIDSMTFNGTVTKTTISIDYTISFPGGGAAFGRIVMTHA